MSNRIAPLFLTVLTLGCALSAPGAEPKTHVFDDFSFLKKGEANGVVVSDRGEFRRGPDVEVLWRGDVPYVLDLSVGPRGELIFSAGASGEVFRLDTDGKAVSLFRTEDALVTAVAASPNGDVYAGTSPGAKIFRITPDGQASLFVDLPDSYVWKIRIDDEDALWVASGEPARLYRIRPDRVDTVLVTSESHFRCLVPDAGGWLLGSADEGRVYRVDGNGKASVLWDDPLEEIVTISQGLAGRLFFSALGRVSTPSQAGNQTSSTAARILSAARSAKQKCQARILEEGGATRKVWDSSEEQIFSAAPLGKGEFLIGTGPEGRVYALDESGRKKLVARLEPTHTVAVVGSGTDWVLATANPGRVVRLKMNPDGYGTYIAPVYDAKLAATWGELQWKTEGDGRVRFYTRSGNTEKPDETWSDWMGPVGRNGDYHVTSPPARFLQWKMEIAGDADFSVREVTLSYRQQNAAPVLKSITVYGPNVWYSGAARSETSRAAQRGKGLKSPKSLGEKKTSIGYRTCSWSFEDPNEDELIFTLEIRRRDWKDWRLLAERMAESAYALDTRTLPDGIYRFRVTASDEPSNPVNEAKTAQLESDDFVVDHTAPTINGLEAKILGNSLVVRFRVEDRLSRVKAAEISLGAGPWRRVAPVDGIADSRTERYEVSLEAMERGTVVSVRAVDEFGNTAYGWTEVR